MASTTHGTRKRKASFGDDGVAGDVLAPNSMRLSGRSCTTSAQFASAAAWDLASGIDPVGLTDLVNWATGLDQ